MYYLVSGTGDGSFEWVIEADSVESARQNAMKDLSQNDKITSIAELSIDECVKREYDDLSYEVKRYYFESRYDVKKITVQEYASIVRKFKETPDLYYKALKEFNCKLRMTRRIGRIAPIDELKYGDLKKYINLLLQAKTEEEFNEILNNLKKKTNESSN